MECELIESDITQFYFGSISDDRRKACENHILSCGRCLTEFLQLKRHIELKPEPFELPNAHIQANLRRKISEVVGTTKVSVIHPLRNRVFQGMAVAASGAAVWIAVVGYRGGKPFKESDVGQIQAEIDTSRDSAVSLNML